ncbi:hypothetical protein [Ktedonospora formicarum]|uniref:hypothetical protein n=1 Tax=Ktedonospora formicarum TaxID=2778364 RepID=UPI001C68738A|nr:hypothetical protein [Ktedonospora formicarum]
MVVHRVLGVWSVPVLLSIMRELCVRVGRDGRRDHHGDNAILAREEPSGCVPEEDAQPDQPSHFFS